MGLRLGLGLMMNLGGSKVGVNDEPRARASDGLRISVQLRVRARV
jgi:hypothetical protein